MILPSKNKKTYGVVHTENYFSFLGFCKKVNNNEIQKVDIFLNDTLIDTIIADKHIEKIEDIYELEGFGFTYNLSEKYIGEKYIISFKNNKTKEDLQNSPYELIDKTHPKFNEYRFLNSLSQSALEEKIKDLYCPNSIGFLATEENLEDRDFIEYIKDLMNELLEVKFIIFYFQEPCKENILKMINNKNVNIQIIQLTSIIDLLKNTEIFLSVLNTSFEWNVVSYCRKYSNTVVFPKMNKVIKPSSKMLNDILHDNNIKKEFQSNIKG